MFNRQVMQLWLRRATRLAVRTMRHGAAAARPAAAQRAAFCCHPMGGSTESDASAGTSMHLPLTPDADELQQRVAHLTEACSSSRATQPMYPPPGWHANGVSRLRDDHTVE